MSDQRKRYYITTPIYYVNGTPHIGTATSTLLADATKRYRRLRGDDAYLLTGTDENARKVLEAAEKAGKETQIFVDEVSERFVETWKFMGIEYDVFFRTTEPRHTRAVQEVFTRLCESGDIYLGTYEGWYSVTDETFFRDTDVDAATQTAKETGAKVERVQEETYFFRLSKYGDAVKTHILANPDFLIPETRRNEVLSFIEQGLRDIAVTQNRTGWGIPVPGDSDKVIYVWFDALINYLTESGWPDDGWESLWPADVHLMAKEIYTRFHATLWPALLMALNLPLPKHVVGHGWWVVGGVKGSKSKNNIPSCEEVVAWLQEQSGASQEICVDALRYYLVRDIRFNDDAEYSREMLVTRFNSDLANDLGNVLNRVLRATYFNGVIPTPRALDAELSAIAANAVAGYELALERFDWGAALQSVWTLVSAVNKYLDEKAPWALAKNGDTAGVADAVYNALEGTRLAAYLVSPVMPYAARQLASQLGLAEIAGFDSWETASKFGALPSGLTIGEPVPLFPRIDMKKAFPPNTPAPTPNTVHNGVVATQRPTPKQEKKMSAETTTPAESAVITIDDFARVEFKVADIISAERIEGAKKLLLLQVSVGGEERQIVSGIADAYAPEDLVGKQIVVVTNLQPATIRGVSSQGMLLAATDAEGRAVLLHPDKPVASGSKVR